MTGRTSGAHLHFETRVEGTARDPEPYLAGTRTIPGTIARQPAVNPGAAPVRHDGRVHANGASAGPHSIAALELLSDVLAGVDEEHGSDQFYSRLAEAVCRLARMDRAVIFSYDDARRRVHAAGAHGVALDDFTDGARHRRVGARRAPRAHRGPRHRGARRRTATTSPRTSPSSSATTRSSTSRSSRPAAGSASSSPSPPPARRRSTSSSATCCGCSARRSRSPRRRGSRRPRPSARASSRSASTSPATSTTASCSGCSASRSRCPPSSR